MHDPSETRIVVYRIMLGTAIIPQGQTALSPPKATGKLWLDLMFKKIAQQWLALLLGPTLEGRGVSFIDLKCLASGFRMRSNYRMGGTQHFQFYPSITQAVFPCSGNFRFGRSIDGHQIIKYLL